MSNSSITAWTASLKLLTACWGRPGIACVVLPADNARDLDELPDYLKEDLEVHFASTFDDVFDIAFCEDRYFDI